MEKVNINIIGMTCSGCVAGAKMALEDVAGVKAVEVTLEPGVASIDFEAPATIAQLEAAIVEAGFTVGK